MYKLHDGVTKFDVGDEIVLIFGDGRVAGLRATAKTILENLLDGASTLEIAKRMALRYKSNKSLEEILADVENFVLELKELRIIKSLLE